VTNESMTLFIPLYGKAMMSREGFLPDKTAEKIVESVDFDFSKVDQSRKLAIYMTMRAALFDGYARDFAAAHPDGLVLQLGVGLDSRVKRVGCTNPWYDLDFPDVIGLRRTYFPEDERYHLIGAPALPADWLATVPHAEHALVLAEGLSMYLSEKDMRDLMAALQANSGDRRRTADEMGISTTTLWRRMRRLARLKTAWSEASSSTTAASRPRTCPTSWPAARRWAWAAASAT